MRSWLVLLLFLANLGSTQPQTTGPDPVTFSDISYSYIFGDAVTFQASITPVSQVKEVYLFLQPEGETTRTEKVAFDSGGKIDFKYSLSQRPLRPFATINFWFRAVNEAGNQFLSESTAFENEDNRFKWQHLEGNGFQVSWITGDLAFGQSILNAAQQGLRSTAALMSVPVPSPIKIYVYTTSDDLQSALSLSQMSWVAGYASPDVGAILVSVAPGPDQESELERQIPHELMHTRVYQAASSAYQQLPTWLNEGLASLAEITPNPDFQSALTQAANARSLISFASLCNGFPTDASGAFLAYSQSVSFVRYIHQKYGSPAFQNLISNYKSGLGCAEGVNAALGISLGQLEVRWRQESLGMDTGSLVIENLAPYLISGLLLLLLPLAYAFLLRKKPAKIAVPSGSEK